MEIDDELLAEELDAVTTVGAYLERPHDLIVLQGADRVRFLNGQVTCDIKTSEKIGTAYGYFTTPKGRIECDAIVISDLDELRVILPAGQGQAILQRLEKYIITDRVELSWRPTTLFYLLGQRGLELLDPLGRAIPKKAYTWTPYELQYQLQTLLRLPDLGIGRDIPCVALFADDAELNAETLDKTDLPEITEGAYQQLRIEAGLPAAGTDFGLDCFPQEVGNAAAVSYTKGCYLGQEVVARIHYRGGVQRQLRGVRIDAALPLPELPLGLRLAGQEVGKVTSRAPLPRGGQVLGLGIVHQKAEPGSLLELVDAAGEACGEAELVELPFPAPMPDLPEDAPVN